MPGILDEIEGAMQHAAQWGRHAGGGGSRGRRWRRFTGGKGLRSCCNRSAKNLRVGGVHGGHLRRVFACPRVMQRAQQRVCLTHHVPSLLA
jgi:hypothetical protein